MATSPTTPNAGGPSSGAGQSGSPAVVQIIAAITKLSNQLAKVFPPASPMADAIQQQLQQVMSKVNETMKPSQPEAPPI